MVKQNNLSPAAGSRSAAKRVGRGNGSGHGTRAGNQKMRPGFEGGQLPLIKKLPRKRGFTNIFRTEYATVSVGVLNALPAGTEITPESLRASGILKKELPIKILADGTIDHAVTVKAHKFSATAKAKIEAAGGTTEEVAYAAKV